MSSKQMRNPSFATLTSPKLTEEDFPPLEKTDKKKLDEEFDFKRFLIIKNKDENVKMSDVSVFKVDKNLKKVMGRLYKWCKISRLRSGLLLIEVVQRTAFDILKNIKKIDDVSVIVEEHQTLNTSKGFITCDAIRGMTNEDIHNEIKTQEVKEVYRIQRRKKTTPTKGNKSKKTDANQGENSRKDDDPTFEPTDSFIITFSTPTLPKTLKIGYLRVNVRLYIPNPRRCNQCQMYGHIKKFCQHDPVCHICGQGGHVGQNCTNDKSCYHCGGKHEATSKDCPMWKLEKLIIEEKTKNNIPFKEARSRIYSSHQNLVIQVPKLNKDNPNKTTFSTISSQQREFVEELLHTIDDLRDQNKAFQLQIQELVNLIAHEKNLKLNPTLTSDTDLPTIDTVRSKRSHLTSSSSEEDLREPFAKRVPPPDGQGVNVSDSQSIPDPVDMGESSPEEESTPPPQAVEKPSLPLVEEATPQNVEAVEMDGEEQGGGGWINVAQDGKHRPSTSTKSAKPADSSHIPKPKNGVVKAKGAAPSATKALKNAAQKTITTTKTTTMKKITPPSQ